jgi:hypothetical protein
MPDEPTTGAMPGAGATPAQAGQPTTTTPAATGAMPQAGTTAPAAAAQSATDDAALGDAGKRILAEARRQAKEAEDRARAAEAERDTLRTATQSDAEKATQAAVKEAEKVITATFEARIRRSEVRSALTAAGISATELDLASAAPEFARLKVTDDGVDGLTESVTTFKALHPALFAKPATPMADLGGGPRGQSGQPSLSQQIAAAEASGDIRTAIHLKSRQLREGAAKR